MSITVDQVQLVYCKNNNKLGKYKYNSTINNKFRNIRNILAFSTVNLRSEKPTDSSYKSVARTKLFLNLK
jgi:hypothetical protein